MLHEQKQHDRNSFLTLTYDEEHVPSDGSLRPRDAQLFWKKLRKAGFTFRYFLCGEYGDITARPHYHAIIFGEDFENDRTLKFKKKENPYYVSDSVDKAWGLGHAILADVNETTISYVAGYVQKKVSGKRARVVEGKRRIDVVDQTTGEIRTVLPQYQSVSRGGRSGQGGIGSAWIKRWKDEVFRDDHILDGDRELKPPDYYESFLSDEERKELKQRRRKRAAKSDPLYAEDLKRKETVAIRRDKVFKG